jgi:hypothetical protein
MVQEPKKCNIHLLANGSIKIFLGALMYIFYLINTTTTTTTTQQHNNNTTTQQ